MRVCEVETSYGNRIGNSKLNTFSDGWRHFRQIVLLAPYMLLITPGIILLTFGALFQMFEFLDPAGLVIGPLHWRPIFLGGIALVVGTQFTVVGLVARDRSFKSDVLTGVRTNQERLKWLRYILPIGTLSTLIGGSIDIFLLVRPLFRSSALVLQEPLASLASSALIIGISLISFGLLYPLFDKMPMPTIPLATSVSMVDDARSDSEEINSIELGSD